MLEHGKYISEASVKESKLYKQGFEDGYKAAKEEAETKPKTTAKKPQKSNSVVKVLSLGSESLDIT